MSIADKYRKLFGIKKRKRIILNEEQYKDYIHKDICEQGTLIQGTCASYRVYDNENKPIKGFYKDGRFYPDLSTNIENQSCANPTCQMLPPDVNIVGDGIYVVEQSHKE